MKKLDVLGAKLCTYQGKIFEESANRFMCSSKIFLRRFYNSEFAFMLDLPNENTFSFETNVCFESILEEYGDSIYGSNKFSFEALYYLGYLTRYICYTREITSSHLYDAVNIYDIVENYYVYHTQDEEWVIARLLEKNNLSEQQLNEDEILKSLFRKDFRK